MARRLFQLGVVGLVGGGGYYAYQKRLSQNSKISADDYHMLQQPRLQQTLVDLQNNPQAFGKDDIKLYRYTTCPFCGKAKTFLDYYKIPYTAIEVDPMLKREISENGYSKVPQLQIGKEGPILVDSDKIVRLLAPIVNADVDDPDVEKWRSWANEILVRHIVLNINRTLPDAYAGYSYIDKFDTIPLLNKIFLKTIGTPVMFLVAKFVTKRRLEKIDPQFDPQADERENLYRELSLWMNEGVGENKFHGGTTPSVADLDVYGIINAMDGHVVVADMTKNTTIGKWLGDMEKELKSKAS